MISECASMSCCTYIACLCEPTAVTKYPPTAVLYLRQIFLLYNDALSNTALRRMLGRQWIEIRKNVKRNRHDTEWSAIMPLALGGSTQRETRKIADNARSAHIRNGHLTSTIHTHYLLRKLDWSVYEKLKAAWYQKLMRTAFLWVIPQRIVVIPYRRFVTTCRSLQGPIGRHETSVRNYHYSLRKTSEQGISLLKLTAVQQTNDLFILYGIWRFIAEFTAARHWAKAQTALNEATRRR